MSTTLRKFPLQYRVHVRRSKNVKPVVCISCRPHVLAQFLIIKALLHVWQSMSFVSSVNFIDSLEPCCLIYGFGSQRGSLQAMEKSPEHGANASKLPSAGIGSRFSNLNKSFKYCLRSLLTSCSKEEVYEAFSSFSNTEKELLHRLFLQVITSLHENLEDGFETICLQTQAGTTLDAVEEIVEEQDLDVLFSDRISITDVAKNLSMAKKNEIQHLMQMVQLGEQHNQMLRTRLQLLKEGNQDLSSASQAVEKLKSMNLNYVANSVNEMHE
ncbi:hypothetical protein VNO78_34998 [Psophocarpus tetragonolobus]|uniref:Uncharacterized protein n=1 Tax=Psophocarpus tetragonolobus TaxID=3891 RepID=A0AAN9RLK5_PSOTE